MFVKGQWKQSSKVFRVWKMLFPTGLKMTCSTCHKGCRSSCNPPFHILTLKPLKDFESQDRSRSTGGLSQPWGQEMFLKLNPTVLPTWPYSQLESGVELQSRQPCVKFEASVLKLCCFATLRASIGNQRR